MRSEYTETKQGENLVNTLLPWATKVNTSEEPSGTYLRTAPQKDGDVGILTHQIPSLAASEFFPGAVKPQHFQAEEV